jgi:hypothetical protein
MMIIFNPWRRFISACLLAALFWTGVYFAVWRSPHYPQPLWSALYVALPLALFTTGIAFMSLRYIISGWLTFVRGPVR